MSSELEIVAVIAARNEADILHVTVRDLVEQGIRVYLIDDASSDGTAESIEAYRGPGGVIGIERVAPEDAPTFSLERLIRRKEELARRLESGWVLNHDADEVWESPWSGVGLRRGIELVDRFGYSAIDLQVLTFWPTDEDPVTGDDPREALRYCAWDPTVNKLQIRCWKQLPGRPLDLVSSGGHEAVFPGRRVFPIRFLLRHYPFRGTRHGARKLFGDRRPRYAPEEKARGWHVQHDHVRSEQDLVRSRSDLTLFDPERVRLELQISNREVERVGADPAAAQLADESLLRERDLLGHELDRVNRRVDALESELDARSHELVRVAGELAERTAALEAMRGSWSWRLTAPLRTVLRALRGR